MGNASDNHMEFGIFAPPMHYPAQNPTRAIQRDIEMLEYADSLGFAEAWMGEHHSGGYEIIGPSDIFLAAALERTQRIRLGTGVVSLPYHHPFHVAERAVFLDHLSMGRFMLGVGPGSLPTDAAMLGIEWKDTRKRMVESWEAIYHLLTSEEPLTRKTEWFTLNEAVLQLRPYSRPLMELAFTAMESPFGPSLAGKYGGSLISLSGTNAKGYGSLARHWSVVEEQAEEHGNTVDRSDWGVVAYIHVAESREQAQAEVANGLPKFAYYTGMVGERDFEWADAGDNGGAPVAEPTVDELIAAFGGAKIACIGTPGDAVEMIEHLIEVTGGFGKVLIFLGHDWAPQDALNRCMELISREVMPVFQGSTQAQQRATERALKTRSVRLAEQRKSITEAQSAYGSGTSTK